MDALLWIGIALVAVVALVLFVLWRVERKRKRALSPLLGAYYGRNADARKDPRK